MPVFVDNQIIQHKHLFQLFAGIGNAELFAAFDIKFIFRLLVPLFERTHNLCRRNKVGFGSDKILAPGAELAVFRYQCIRHMRDAEPIGNLGRKHLVVGFLAIGRTGVLKKHPLTVDDLPFLFEVAVCRVVGGYKACAVRACAFAEQNIADVLREGIFKEVYPVPIQRFIGRRNPVLIGQAKSEALFDQLLRGGQLQLLQHIADTFPACGNGTLCPPAVESFPFHTDFIVSAERQMLCVMNFAERDDVGIFVKFQIHDRDVAVHKGIQHENSSFPCDYYFLLYHFSLGIAREMMLIIRHQKN